MKPAGCVFVFVFCAALCLGAQEESARIYHAEGTDFTVTLRGERIVFSAESVWREGINLEPYEVVQTGTGTMLEIQLIPSGILIKLAENTSLTYNGIDSSGNFAELGLLYGSIRVVTGIGANSVAVRGGGVTARVGNGDFGVDYVIEPDIRNSAMRPLFRVYPFRGRAEVFPYGRDTIAYFGGAQLLAVEQGESLSLDVSSPYTYAERKALGREKSDYWRRNDFSGRSPLPIPDTGIAYNDTVPVYGSPPFFQPPAASGPRTVPEQLVIARNRQKNIALTMGLVLILGSLGVQEVSSRVGTAGNSTAENLYNGAYATLGLGVVTTLAGIMFRPLPSAR
jgi:hypothetical protein